MQLRWTVIAGSAAFALVLNSGFACAQSDKIMKQLTTDQMESMLKDFKIDYKKVKSKSDESNAYFYDFERSQFKITLHFFGGKDIMLDCIFDEYPLDKLNGWNKRAKFSRATQHVDKK